jgi:hypothetical protein
MSLCWNMHETKSHMHGNIGDTMLSKGGLHLTQCTKLDKGN